MNDALLEVRDLVKHFTVTRGAVLRRRVGVARAVDGVSFDVPRGRTVGLVGESGCGKSTVARCILRLLRPTSGRILFDGTDIVTCDQRTLRRLRRRMQIVFQDPYASLNPRMSVGALIAEPLEFHRLTTTRRETGTRVGEMLERVGMTADSARRYPHQFSGGQRQRIAIARALASSPALLVLDEPVSALDVSIQAQILNLLDDLQRDLSLSYLFIAHDLSLVRHLCHHVLVMYLGEIVESAARDELFDAPQHPYTQALLSAVPVPDPRLERARRRIPLRGDVPSALGPPPACRFHTRCFKAQAVCSERHPPLEPVAGPDHLASCFFAEPMQVVASKQRAGSGKEGSDGR